MANVTPPGEGPPPLGRGVDPASAGPRPAGWPTVTPWDEFLIPDTSDNSAHELPGLDANCYAPGTHLAVDTAAGPVEVATVRTATGCYFALLRPFGTIPVGTHVGLERVGDSLQLRVLPGQQYLALPPAPAQRTLTPEEAARRFEKYKPAAQDAPPEQARAGAKADINAYLAKAGPVGPAHTVRAQQDRAKQAAIAFQIALLKQEADRLEAEQGREAAAPVPTHPGRAGRAIELD